MGQALCYLIRGRRNQERLGANLVPSRASDASRYPIGLMAYASGARALCRKFFESDDRPVHFVQVRPASQAEWQKRIDTAILGQLRGRELPQLHARFQGDLDEFSNHSVRFVHNVRRSKEPHSVCKPDEVLFIAIERDLVLHVSIQKPLRSAHNKVGVDRLPFRQLSRDPLQTILVALSVDGRNQRSAASYERSNER